MKTRGSRWGAMFVVAVAATALRCADRDVSRIVEANQPDPLIADAGAQPLRCVPGQTLACNGVCGGVGIGYQVCAGDGRSYGECLCPPPNANERPFIAIEPGTVLLSPEVVPRIRLPDPVRPDAPLEPVQPGIVGLPCAASTDCQGSLSCLTASSTAIAGGGIAGGYCTRDCASNDDCRRVDPASACVTLGESRMCVRLCLSQTPEENEPKCLFRSDLTCISLSALGGEAPVDGERQVGLCMPQCQSDASCGGRRCDISRGICTDTPRSGDPIGASCEQAETCEGGVCGGLSQQADRFCSAFCTLGVAGCGYAEGGTPGAACLFSQVQGEGDGDLGLCVEVCATDSDCVEPGAECVPLESSPLGGVCLRFRDPVIEPPDNEPPDNEPPDNEPPDGGSGEPEPGPITGRACEDDAACGDGVCLTSDSDPFGVEGGPAGGYCSASCASNSDCESGALCLPLREDRSGVCFLRCSLEDADACHGRDTLVCNVTSGAANGFCQPVCNGDADCGDRVCDGPDGLCIDPCTSDSACESGDCDESSGHCVPGAPCELDADCDGDRICDLVTDTCARAPAVRAGGLCSSNADCPGDACLGVTATTGFCSAECVLRTEVGCELYGTDAFCLLRLPDLPPGIGLCAGLCNVPEDCATPGFVCAPIPGGAVNGKIGACLP